MARFAIGKEDYELKLTFESVKHLNAQFSGGALELVGRAVSGDLDTYVKIVHAGLFHTGKNIGIQTVEEELMKQFEAEKLDLQTVLSQSHEIVTNSFFYRPTLEKLLAKDPNAKAQLDLLLT